MELAIEVMKRSITEPRHDGKMTKTSGQLSGHHVRISDGSVLQRTYPDIHPDIYPGKCRDYCIFMPQSVHPDNDPDICPDSYRIPAATGQTTP
jgi:hypothetical protein